MNKKMENFAQIHNLRCENNSIYGIYNGYQICINIGGEVANACVVSVIVNLGEKLNEFLLFAEGQKKALKIMQMSVGNGVHFLLTHWAVSSSLANAQKILDTVTAKLQEMQLQGDLCIYCNQKMDNPLLVCDGVFKFFAHEECFNKKLQQVQDLESAEAQKPNNYLKGWLGAFLGALAGGVLFAVLYAMGYLAAISSIVGAFCASALYGKFGGKNDKMKIVAVTVATFVVTVIAFALSYTVDIAILLQEEGIQANAFAMLVELLATDSEFASAVLGDFVMTMVFYIIGIVCAVSAMVKQQKKTSASMKKLN